MPSLSRSCHTPATATKGTEPLPSHSSQKTRKTREGGGCLQSLSVEGEYSTYRSTWVDPRSWFLGLLPLLLEVGAMHGTHYETTNPSLVCTNPTSSGQTAGSNLAVIASVRSSRALAGWAFAAAGAGQARQPGRAQRIGRRRTKRSIAALRATQPHFDDQIETSVRIAAPSKLGESTQVDL